MNVGEMKTATANAGPDNEAKGKLGLIVRSLTQDERKKVNASDDEGLMVERVVAGPAARAGIRPGDIVLSVNGEKAGSEEQLHMLVDKNGKRLALLIVRADGKLFVPVSIE